MSSLFRRPPTVDAPSRSGCSHARSIPGRPRENPGYEPGTRPRQARDEAGTKSRRGPSGGAEFASGIGYLAGETHPMNATLEHQIHDRGGLPD